MFMYNPIRYVQENKDTKLKIFYFSLEMSAEQKLRQAISNKLYMETKGEVRIDPQSLRSVRQPVEDSILSQVEGYSDYFKEFDKTVTFIDNIKNPYGIYKFMEDYAEQNGDTHYKEKVFENTKTGEKKVNRIFDYYEAYDPDEYVLIIIDHISLISKEKEHRNLHESITKLSSDYLVKLRNRYNFSPVVIQQQSAAQEGIENMKANRLKPSLDGLADNKLTQRDADVILGLFSPYRHSIKQYPEKGGYNIMKFKDQIRFMEILASREGGGNSLCPLYFDGAVNYFMELPSPDETKKIEQVYRKFLK
jgi:replicative DNA helicase